MGQAGLDVSVLGPLHVSVTGIPVALGAAKQRAVLAMLVINRNRAISADTLIDAVWGDDPIPAARASVQAYVSNLRRVLGTGRDDARTVLASAPPGYRLQLADANYDLGRFKLATSTALQASAAGQFETATCDLTAALSEWRGPALDDLRGYSFVDTFTTALTEDKLTAHSARAEAEIACGRANSIIGELELLAAEYPYREPLWVQLVTAYYVTERQSDALQCYQRLKTRLAEDLGIDPGPTVTSLYGRILRQEPIDAKRAAQATATRTLIKLAASLDTSGQVRAAGLRYASGQFVQLQEAVTHIGRLADNDIVLDDAAVSRHHAIIVNTGTGFVITDQRSANGIEVNRRRIANSANLDNGDHIRIGDNEFTLEISSS
ncbi:regulator [Mycobacterium sp. CBMA 234]|uniref:BTAD domain-containing putative transcriptional regulator n=1 Tax=Mycolicibacterium sp. CBMA 234 TaxID=1918495 RepID=UPI0012DEEBCB|nr:BTAD domain-containing putative transcriptional regulator [Mycolicibacterium sp. CBMA 234]MUL65196.1 regulator [Mycolicibacterium sp. CBMA 234]